MCRGKIYQENNVGIEANKRMITIPVTDTRCSKIIFTVRYHTRPYGGKNRTKDHLTTCSKFFCNTFAVSIFRISLAKWLDPVVQRPFA